MQAHAVQVPSFHAPEEESRILKLDSLALGERKRGIRSDNIRTSCLNEPSFDVLNYSQRYCAALRFQFCQSNLSRLVFSGPTCKAHRACVFQIIYIINLQP